MRNFHLVGEKDKFAIQWQIENGDKHWRWGRFLLWVGGFSFGDWEDDRFTLNGIVSNAKELYELDPNIINPKLFNYSNDEVFERVIKPLYYSLGLLWEEIAPLEEEYRIHFLTELFQIDTTHLLYVEKDDLQRCIWLDTATEKLGDVILTRGYIQKTLREFVETFEKEDQAHHRPQ